MTAVYGQFDKIPEQDVATWDVPPQPGDAGHRGRYLWTDAFGVVNFLTLFRETGERRYVGLAERLVQAVHDVLGRTRDGTARLPGATDAAPLGGGLRIGKADDAGPDADGQYHHYLTLWMFALNCLALAAHEPRYNDLAIQLARAVHPRFVVAGRDGHDTLVWKVATDLSRPLVRSKGHLDDVTGLAVFELLQSTSPRIRPDDPAAAAAAASLDAEIAQYAGMVGREGELRSSADMLDLGMSLWVAHLDMAAGWSRALGGDALRIARGALLDEGAAQLARRGTRRRLAFREFGACLGVKCWVGADAGAADGDRLIHGADALLASWEGVMYDETPADLVAITLVMYAAALIPGAFRKTIAAR